MKRSARRTMAIRGFHRRLGLRLAGTGIVLSLLFALATWYSARNEVGEAIVERAVQGAIRFNSWIDDLIETSGMSDRAAIQRELEAFWGRRVPDPDGAFVWVDVFDLAGRLVAKRSDDGYAQIAAVRALAKAGISKFPAPGEFAIDLVRIHEVPHLSVTVPLTDRGGKVVAYMRGVYAVSPATVKRLGHEARGTMLSVIGIVLATTALLYPTIILLTRRLTRLSLSLLDANLETLRVLGSAIAKRDSDTDAHNYRVTLLSVRLAEKAGLDPKAMQGLIKGAFLHDVGKIGIRDSILLKPGSLTDEEFEVMRTHVPHGMDIVTRSAWLQDALDVVSSHHEKFDGSGYCRGLRGTDIPLVARIFAIADVFDALTSRRPYKEPFSLEETLEILEKGRGSHFDPGLLDAFLEMASDLYRGLAGKDMEALRRDLEAVTERYFSREAEIELDGKAA